MPLTLEQRVEKLEKLISEDKKPHECPVCQGMRKFKVFGQDRVEPCPACEGKGIVWYAQTCT